MRRRLRDWADAFELWLDEHRSTRVARGAVVGFIAHDVLQYAGAMAYFAVLSMVNLFILGVVALTFNKESMRFQNFSPLSEPPGGYFGGSDGF